MTNVYLQVKMDTTKTKRSSRTKTNTPAKKTKRPTRSGSFVSDIDILLMTNVYLQVKMDTTKTKSHREQRRTHKPRRVKDQQVLVPLSFIFCRSFNDECLFAGKNENHEDQKTIENKDEHTSQEDQKTNKIRFFCLRY